MKTERAADVIAMDCDRSNEENAKALGVVERPPRANARIRECRYILLLAIADVFAAALSLLSAVHTGDGDVLAAAAPAALPLVVVASACNGLYARDELVVNKTTLDEAPTLFALATLYTLLIVVLQDLVIDGALEVDQILVLWSSLFVVALVTRHVARRVGARLSPEERCLFVGSLASCRRLSTKLEDGGKPARVIAQMSIGERGAEGNDVAALHRLIDEVGVHRVIIEPTDSSPELTLDFVREAKATGARVSVLPRILEVVGTAIEPDDIDGITLLGIRRFGLSRSSRFVKRSFDLMVAGVMMIAVAPLMAVIAVLIKCDSLGAVFYRAPRVGRDGRVFEMWKFRSMITGADVMREQLEARNQAAAGLFKMADDPRATRVGRRLRRASLDEMPQLLNVLRGEMSLVGPRPLVIDEDAQITGLDRRRLHLTPGMTGHWQILGSSRVALTEMVKLDYVYVANWSLWTDVKIILRTIPYVLRRRGM